jgi:hypothetical protein
MSTNFTWLLHANDEGKSGNKRQIAVNWVMPTNMPDMSEPLPMRGEDAFNLAGELMWPWKMEVDAWWTCDGTSPPIQLATEDQSLVQDVAGIHALLQTELFNKSAACEKAFSMHPDELRPGKAASPRVQLPVDQCADSSLPHLFASLTQLPAAMSNHMLGMCRSFRCEPPKGEQAYLPEFTLNIGGGQLVRFSPDPKPNLELKNHGFTNHLVAATYLATSSDGTPYLGGTFSIITQKIDTSDDSESFEATAHVMSSDLAETGTRALKAATVLAPLPMLGELFGDADWSIENPATLEDLLMRALGPGLLRMDDKEPVMIWERLEGANSISYSSLVKWWTTDECTVFQQLKKIYYAEIADPYQRLACLAPLYESYAEPRLGFAALGRLFTDGTTSRTVTIAWLATTAVLYAKFTKDGSRMEGSSFSEWYDKLDAVIGVHDLIKLQSAWWRQGELADEYSHNKIREVADISDRWAEGNFLKGDLETLVASQSAALAWLAFTGQPLNKMQDKLQDKLRHHWIEALQSDMSTPGLSEPAGMSDEVDLSIAVKMPNHAAGSKDKALRGFAIAVAAGFHGQAQEALNWAWVTKTAGMIKDSNGHLAYFVDKAKKENEVKTKLEFHDTVGATMLDGRAMATFLYTGEALNGILREDKASVDSNNVDADSVDGLVFVWPKPAKGQGPDKKWMTPQLAYGLNYFARATAIGNAGKVLSEDLACKDDDRQPAKLTPNLFERPKAEPYRYLCRVAPKGTTVVPKEPLLAYAMENDSRTWARLKGRSSYQGSRIAVIRPVEIKLDGTEIWTDSSPHHLEFSLVPPSAKKKVLTRWIEADIAQRQVGNYDPKNGDSASWHLSQGELESVRNTLLENLRENVDPLQQRARHPAVRAFGVRVTFTSPAKALMAVLVTVTKIEKGYMQPASIICTAANLNSHASVVGDTLKIALRPEDDAKLEVWTLVPEIFFANEHAPLALGRMANFTSDQNFDHLGMRYRGFEKQQHYFECAPLAASFVAEAKAAMEDTRKGLELIMDGKDVAARIQSVNGVKATWLKGFHVERHEWHWTGYPLALPRMLRGSPCLLEWSEAFVGTESYRGTDPVLLETDTRSDWRFGTTDLPSWVMRFNMAAWHGARFVACILRSLLRFGDWLKGKSEVENLLLAVGHLAAARVDWSDPGLRLAPPTLRAVVPLVRTYHAEGKEVRAGANGALLCLDEAICRTDSLALFGGVGEIIDVDLVETRINGVFEIGPNPIMHASPESDATTASATPGEGVAPPKVTSITLPYCERYGKVGSPEGPRPKMDWDILVERPFGLTFDLDRNPKVAHTALVVSPSGHSVSTYWIMAKVRLRRMLDPDEAWTADGCLPRDGLSWMLGRRPEGDDRIPFDFAIDGLDNAQFVFKVEGGFGVTIEAPTVPVKRRRLLCSWHKGHWSNTGEIFWGLQVRDQALDTDGAQWRTFERYSAFETFKSTQALSFKDGRPVALSFGGLATALRLLLSDYGEPHWLTFIGMPYRRPALANESYGMELVDKEKAIVLTRSSLDGSIERISRDLLINPVEEKHLGGTSGSERVAAEPHVFHLLLVFARINDVAVPVESNPLGQLVGVYRPEREAITATKPYPLLRFVDYRLNSDSTLPDGAVGFLYKFQNVSHMNDTGNPANPANWEEVLDAMFPPHSASEATVRWLPEFVGPICEGSAPHGRPFEGSEIIIKLDSGPKFYLGIDKLQGWALRESKSSKAPWQQHVTQGTWVLNSHPDSSKKLEIEAPGGRLLFQLDDWSSAVTGLVHMFDDNGAAGVSGKWKLL